MSSNKIIINFYYYILYIFIYCHCNCLNILIEYYFYNFVMGSLFSFGIPIDNKFIDFQTVTLNLKFWCYTNIKLISFNGFKFKLFEIRNFLAFTINLSHFPTDLDFKYSKQPTNHKNKSSTLKMKNWKRCLCRKLGNTCFNGLICELKW